MNRVFYFTFMFCCVLLGLGCNQLFAQVSYNQNSIQHGAGNDEFEDIVTINRTTFDPSGGISIPPYARVTSAIFHFSSFQDGHAAAHSWPEQEFMGLDVNRSSWHYDYPHLDKLQKFARSDSSMAVGDLQIRLTRLSDIDWAFQQNPPHTWINQLNFNWVPRFGGDIDSDGDVDFTDFLLFSDAMIDPVLVDATWEQGDFTGDGVVDFADFLVLSDNFGAGED